MSRKMLPKDAGILHMIVEGGVWTQRRLYAARYTLDDKCLVCGSLGSYYHRCYDCPAGAAVRDVHFEGVSAKRWADEEDECVWERLLVPDPSWHAPRPLATEQ